MSNYDLDVLSAMFAASNMGQTPEQSRVERAVKNCLGNLHGAVMSICEPFIESDEHYEVFLEEAYSWAEQLGGQDDAEIEKMYPHITDLYNICRDRVNG